MLRTPGLGIVARARHGMLCCLRLPIQARASTQQGVLAWVAGVVFLELCLSRLRGVRLCRFHPTPLLHDCTIVRGCLRL